MKIEEVFLSGVTAVLIMVAAFLVWPVLLPNRVVPGITLDALAVGGFSEEDLTGALQQFEEDFLSRTVRLEIASTQKTYQLRDLGITIDMARAQKGALEASRMGSWLRSRDMPLPISFNEEQAQAVLHKDVASQLHFAQNATLLIGNTTVPAVMKSAPGEQVDVLALEQDISKRVAAGNYEHPIPLHIISAAPAIQDSEVASAQILTERLLQQGFIITFEDKQYEVKPFTVRRLIMFVPQPDPTSADNQILGVQFNKDQLQQYLESTIGPEVNQEAVNARFELASDQPAGEAVRVRQFALPQRGQQLDIEGTLVAINQALASGATGAQLAVAVTEPHITDTTAIEQMGVTELLAQGESNFAGSPRNRIHNIQVGASRYHGLMIAPGEEFGFNEHLGPVDASGGFKPELVIKSNVTTPEFGGGLCQVSTTAFRAALHSGLEITERRNHSYAVSYYGTPGFDATIYPGHTDLRFLNNTPGYILIQTRIEDTKLIFDFWGTKDGRVVEVDGPHPYNRRSDGAVKATLSQAVRKDGQVLIEETFYSNYKSPKLFPKVLSANGEAPPNNATPTPSPTPANPGTQNQNPAPSAAPKKPASP